MSLSCLDDDGNAVDGWTSLKGNNGYAIYNYDTSTKTFVASVYTMNQTTSGSIMNTLNPLYDASINSSFAYALYNDNPPETGAASSSYAHSKGILATSSTQGFWLVHSLPNWPAETPTGNPGVPPSDTYAQSLGCVTVNVNTIDLIANLTMVNRPKIYEHHMPSTGMPSIPFFEKLIDNDYYDDAPTSASQSFQSLAGVDYVQFAKSKEWEMDLYDDLIAPYYQTPLYVETWINGAGGRQSSVCQSNVPPDSHQKVNAVYDIYQIDLITLSGEDTWKNTQDHSKYAFAAPMDFDTNVTSSSNVTCIGDINRMCSQEDRGGGAMCHQNHDLMMAFRSIVSGTESCYEKDPCDEYSCYWCELTYAPTSNPTLLPDAPTIQPTIQPNDNALARDENWAAKHTAEVVLMTLSAVALIVCIAYRFYYNRSGSYKKKENTLDTPLHTTSTNNSRASFDLDIFPDNGDNSDGNFIERMSRYIRHSVLVTANNDIRNRSSSVSVSCQTEPLEGLPPLPSPKKGNRSNALNSGTVTSAPLWMNPNGYNNNNNDNNGDNAVSNPLQREKEDA
jgi:deoxyribonuclease II